MTNIGYYFMNKALDRREPKRRVHSVLNLRNYGKEKLDIMRKETVYQIIQLVVGTL